MKNKFNFKKAKRGPLVEEISFEVLKLLDGMNPVDIATTLFFVEIDISSKISEWEEIKESVGKILGKK